MFILLFIILWIIIWNILIEKDIKKIKKCYFKKIKFFKKRIKDIEHKQDDMFDYINSIYTELESSEKYEKN